MPLHEVPLLKMSALIKGIVQHYKKIIYNKIINLAGLLRYPQSPCIPPIMTLTTPRSYAPDPRLGWEWAQCSSLVDVTSLLHLAPPSPAPLPPPRATTQHVWLGEATLSKAGEERCRHSKTELKASVWIPLSAMETMNVLQP